MTNGLLVEPFPFQEEVLKEIDAFKGRVLLTLDMGLGKTFTTLKWLQRHPESFPALVVCPASVKFNWELEAAHFIGVRASVCEGQTPPEYENDGLTSVPQLTIINHDILRFWVPYIEKLGIRTLVMDECQNFIHGRAKRTKAALQISKGKRHLFALSGTPLTNRPAELWPVLNMLWPDDFPSFWSFSQSYCAPRWTPWGGIILVLQI